MGRLIDADALKEYLKSYTGMFTDELGFVVNLQAVLDGIDFQATTDIVPKGLFDQIKWERDVAIGQLQEIGCELGQKMNDVVQVVRCKDCKYWICEEQTINGKKAVRCAVDDERWTEGNDFCSFGKKFVHGHWVEDPGKETIVCSNCGQEFGLEFKIDVCMNCYAKMDGKEE